jgi:hypothetical protein
MGEVSVKSVPNRQLNMPSAHVVLGTAVMTILSPMALTLHSPENGPNLAREFLVLQYRLSLE